MKSSMPPRGSSSLPGSHARAGSSALIEDAVREQLGFLYGGRKFMATLCLGTVLNMTFAPTARAVITVDGSNSPMDNKVLGSAAGSDDGVMDINSGGSANSTIVNYGGKQYINGGIASSTTVNGGGSQFISSGGIASDTTVSGGGRQYISSGGIANDTTVSGGMQYISSGGIANDTMLNNQSWQYISSGGSAISTTTNSGGRQNISSGGIAISATVNSGGSQYISSGGIAISATVNSGGWQYIASGGIASATTLSSGGWQEVLSGGSSFNVTQEIGGNLDVFVIGGDTSTVVSGTNASGNAFSLSGGVAENFIIYSGGCLDVAGGGIASSTIISSGGMQHIGFSGIAHSTTVSSGGRHEVLSGGSSFNVTQEIGGNVDVKVDGSDTATVVSGINASGNAFSLSGGVAENFIIYSGGLHVVENGGSSFNVTQKADGNVNVNVNGGDTTVVSGTNASGNAFSLSGGVAENFILYGYGLQYINSGGVANSTIVDFNGLQGIHSGGTANFTTLNNGGMQYLLEGAVANFTIVNSSGLQDINSGGIAYSAIVNSGGRQKVSSGGIANSTIVNSGGLQNVESGGVANSATLNGGAQYVDNSGIAYSATVNSGGRQEVSSGGIANSTIVNSGGEQVIYSSGIADSTIVSSSGLQKVESGGVANSATLNGGAQYVDNSGIAYSATLNSGGRQEVSSGGSADSTIVNSGGRQKVSSGGIANSTIVSSGGSQKVESGGSSLNVTQNIGGNVIASVSGGDTATVVSGTNASGSTFSLSGGMAENFIINSGGGQLVYRGGIASSTIVNSGGSQDICSGGIASSTTINTGGAQKVESSGIASSTIVSSGGLQAVSSGGSSLNVTQKVGGNVVVSVSGGDTATVVSGTNASGSAFSLSGGMAENFIIYSGGGQLVYRGGIASSTIVNSGGSQDIYSGGSSLNVTQNVGGNVVVSVSGGDTATVVSGVNASGSAFSLSNGVAENFIIYSGGGQLVYSGGIAGSTIVNSGGRQDIHSGGIASATTVTSGGTLFVDSGGVLRGDNSIRNTGILSAAHIFLDGKDTVLRIERDGDDTLATVLQGAGGLVKEGSATLTLTAANTHTGQNTVSAGTLKAGADNALGQGAYDVKAGAVLDINGTTQTIGELQGDGDTSIGAGSLTVSQDSDTSYHGQLGGTGAFAKAGSGTLVLENSVNTFTGRNTVSAGTLRAGADNALGQGAYDVKAGAVLDINGTTQTIGELQGSGNTGIGAGSLTVNQDSDTPYHGRLSGTGTFTKTGIGTLSLNNAANTFTGRNTVSAGTLRAGADGALGQGAYDVKAGAVLDINGTAQTVGELQGGGEIHLGAGDLTVSQAADTVYSGQISGSGTFAKAGSGTLTLSGANTYTGQTIVRGGVLELGSDLTASSGLTLYDGSVFKTGGHSHSLDAKELTVWGNAVYDGSLSARGAIMNFITPGVGAETMLAVTGAANIDGSKVNLGVSGSRPLPTGAKLSLLKAADGLSGAVTQGDGSGIIQAGATVVHNITLQATADELFATVGAGSVIEGAKSLSEAFLGGTALTLQGADLVAGQGLDAAVQAALPGTKAEVDGEYSLGSFTAASGASVRYDTGSYVDMRSVNVLTGFSLGVNLLPGRLTVGAFFEYGNGSYDTHNSFSNAASVDGDGSTHYLGGGILGRMNFEETGPGHVYTEASVRAGKVYNDYDGSNLRDSQGHKANYDSVSPYYGLHLGAGYVWNIADKAELDLHGKYFWTRQEGDGVSLSTGESVRFKNIDSQRLRAGSRFVYTINEYVKPYIGAAWEHEFGGKARAYTNGLAIDAPDLKGSTGTGELGLIVKPSTTLPLSFDLGVQGYTGKREGVTGSLQIKIEF